MRQHLTKALSLLCAALILSTAIPARAGELPVNKSLLKEEFSQGVYRVRGGNIAWMAGRVLFVSDAQLVSVDPVSGKADNHPLPLPRGQHIPGSLGLTLLSQGDQLRVMDIDRGLLYPLTITRGEPALSEPLALRDWDDYIELYYDTFDYPDMREPLDFLLLDDSLWVLQVAMVGFEVGGPFYWVTRYDLQSGRGSQLDMPFISAITPYKDGKLLVSTAYSTGDDGQFKPGRFALLDPDALSVQELFPEERQPWAISWDKESDTVYAASELALYRYDMQTGKSVLCAQLPQWGRIGGMRILGPDQLAYIQYNGLSLLDTNAERLNNKTPLVMMGSLYTPGIRETTEEQPQYRVSEMNRLLSYADLMLTDSQSFDLVSAYSDSLDFRSAAQKGYTMDLSGISKVRDYVDSLYPALRDAVTMDGKIYGIPIGLHASSFGYDRDFFELIGCDVPRTFMELLSFIGEWQEKYAEDHPDRLPIEAYDLRGELIYAALELYQNQMTLTNKPFTWNSPLLSKMLSAIDRIKDPKTGGEPWEEDSPTPVITRYFSVTPAFIKGNDSGTGMFTYPVLLSADEGMEPPLMMNVNILFVNSASARKEAAADFAQRCIDHISPANLASMSPDKSEPVPRRDYQRALRTMERELAALEDAASVAEGAEKTELTRQAEEYAGETARYRDNERWEASAADIAAYRAFTAYSFVEQKGQRVNIHDLSETISLYTDKQIGLEQFIREIEGKTRLMMLENQ